MKTTARHHAKSRRFTLPTIIAGAIGSVLVAFSMTPSFAALTASINDTLNTAGTGYISMQEVSGSNTCNSTDGGSVSTNNASCTTINAYGGNLAMTAGSSSTTTITVKNTGSLAATAFTLTPGTCTQSNNGTANGSATTLCAQYNIVITVPVGSNTVTVYSGTAAAFTTAINLLGSTILNTSTVPAATSYTFTVTATLSSTAGDTFQGLMITQPLTWQYSA